MLWAYAKLGKPPHTSVLEGLLKKAEETAVGFNAQDIASTLWALAKLGIAPSGVLLESLSQRAVGVVAGFNSQVLGYMVVCVLCTAETVMVNVCAFVWVDRYMYGW